MKPDNGLKFLQKYLPCLAICYFGRIGEMGHFFNSDPESTYTDT